MATVEELERLATLLDQLLPLTTRTPGELIEAEDWNTIARVLIEVGRAAMADREAAAVAAHDHPDQVSVGWLDQQLKQLVTGGGVKDPGAESDLLRLRRDLTLLNGRLDRADNALDEVRLRVADVSTQVVLRESDLGRLDRKVLGAADTRGDIADLRRSLQTIESEVGRAVEVGGRLEFEGRPIDVPGLAARMGEVEKLRDRFTGANGELLDAAALERRVAELQATLVTQETLTTSLGDLREDILNNRGGGVFDPDIFLDEVRATARESAAAQVDTLGADLRSTLDARLAQIEPATNAAVDRATADLADRVRESVRADVQQVLARNNESLRGELEASFQARLDRVSDGLNERLGEVRARVSEQVNEQLRSQIPDMLAEVDRRLDRMEVRITDLGGRTGVLEDGVATDRTRSEEALRAEAAARSRLRADIIGQLDVLDSGLDARISRAVDGARDILRTELTTTVDAAKRDLARTLAEVARQQAATEVQVLSTSIRTDVQSAIRQEIEANLSSVRADIAGEVEGLHRQIGGLVAAEVTRVTATIPSLVQSQVDSFRPEIDRIVDARIRSVPGGPFRPPQ